MSQMTQRLTSHLTPKSDEVIPEAIPYKGPSRDAQGCPLSLRFSFRLCWVSVAVCSLPLFAARGGLLFAVVWASHCSGFSCCRTQALGTWASAAAAWGLSNSGSQALEHWLSACGAQGLLALQHVGSFLNWDGTHDPCIGRPTLNN